MRSDIIDEILSVEDHAQSIVKDAMDQSHEMVMAAQTKATETIHNAVVEQRESDKKELQQAESDCQVSLENYCASLEGQESLSSSDIDTLAKQIVKKVSQTVLFGDLS